MFSSCVQACVQYLEALPSCVVCVCVFVALLCFVCFVSVLFCENESLVVEEEETLKPGLCVSFACLVFVL